MATVIFCLTTSEFQAEAVVNELKVAGFSDADISVLLPDKAGAVAKKAREKTSTATGGGAFGWLPGIGSLSIPGAGLFIATGPISAALNGVAVGGMTGGIAGALAGIGLTERDARRYEQKIQDGNILVAIHSENADSANRVKSIFEQVEAEDIIVTGDSDTAINLPPEIHEERWEQW